MQGFNLNTNTSGMKGVAARQRIAGTPLSFNARARAAVGRRAMVVKAEKVLLMV